MNERRKALEAYATQLRDGNPLAEDFITPSKRVDANALKARNLAEETLANEVLKNTGVPIPDNSVSRLQKEDFLNRIVKEQYPEFEPDIQLNSFIKDHGAYTPQNGKILIRDKDDVLKQAATSFHEAGHAYDDKVLKFDGTDDVKFKNAIQSAPKNRILTDLDPAEVYELMAKGHHAEIPNLREGSFGLGALKSYLKNGTFKTIAGALPLAGTAMALSSGDASAAVEELPSEIPVFGQAYDAMRSEPAGNSFDDREIRNEVKALQNYDKSAARRDALMRLRNGQ